MSSACTSLLGSVEGRAKSRLTAHHGQGRRIKGGQARESCRGQGARPNVANMRRKIADHAGPVEQTGLPSTRLTVA